MLTMPRFAAKDSFRNKLFKKKASTKYLLFSTKYMFLYLHSAIYWWNYIVITEFTMCKSFIVIKAL